MGYSAKAIANYFLDLAKRDGVEITPLKIQKLVYIAHGWHLALTVSDKHPDGEPLVDDEYAEAWPYGPVFPSLYHEFKHFGADEITDYAEDVEFVGQSGEGRIITPFVRTNDVNTQRLLDRIWEVYGDFPGPRLSRITHNTGTPWAEIWEKNKGRRNTHIPDELIGRYYRNLMEQNSGE